MNAFSFHFEIKGICQMVEWNISELSFFFFKDTNLGITKPIAQRKTRLSLLIDCVEKQLL